MLAARPFADDAALFDAAARVWRNLGPDDWREAFAHHPRIGEQAGNDPRQAATADLSEREQSGVNRADEQVRPALVDGNRAYEARFGHVFLICATGRSAEGILVELERRLRNDAETELRIAAAEQAKITRLRLAKLGD